jgi:hypothetical protein
MKRTAGRGHAWWRVAAVVLGIMVLAAACGSSGTSSSTPSSPAAASSASSPAASPVVCQDVAALRRSLTNLTHVKVGKGAVDELKADVSDVQAKLSALKDQVGTEWSAQISLLQSALSMLHTAVTGLGDGTSSVTSVVTAVGGVAAAAQSLLAAAATRCPSASPSSS